jgi:hypothetical protein
MLSLAVEEPIEVGHSDVVWSRSISITIDKKNVDNSPIRAEGRGLQHINLSIDPLQEINSYCRIHPMKSMQIPHDKRK